MTILDRFLEIARQEVGVAEIPGQKSNKRILEYLATCKDKPQADEVPWCSAFVNWVVNQAGEVGTNSLSARSWQEWGKLMQSPQPGCIAVFRRTKNPVLGHVGIFVSRTRFSVKIIGGNQNNRVSEGTFSSADLICYRCPSDFLIQKGCSKDGS